MEVLLYALITIERTLLIPLIQMAVIGITVLLFKSGVESMGGLLVFQIQFVQAILLVPGIRRYHLSLEQKMIHLQLTGMQIQIRHIRLSIISRT